MDANNNREIKSVGAASLSCVIGDHVSVNKYVIFGVNTVCALIFVLRRFTSVGLAAFSAVSLILFLAIFFGYKDVPAVSTLPLTLLADAVIYTGINYFDITRAFSFDNSLSGLPDSTGLFWMLFVIGLIIGVMGAAKSRAIWVTGVSGMTIGSSFIVLFWDRLTLLGTRGNNAPALLLLFCIAAGLWTILLYIISTCVPDKGTGTMWIGIILLTAFIAGLFCDIGFINGRLPVWKTALLESPHTLFAWWLVILISVIIIVAVYVLYVINGDDGSHLSVDTYALIILGELILTTRLLISNYFSFNCLVLAPVIIGTVRCMKNDYRQKKTLGLSSIAYLTAQLCVTVVFIFLLKRGLWILALLSAVFFILFTVEANRPRKSSYDTVHWALILLCITSVTAAWTWRYNYSAETIKILAMSFVIGCITLLTVNIKQPGSRTAPDELRIIICCCVALLCIAVTTRHGAKIKSRETENRGAVAVELIPRGKANSIESAYYYWRDGTGKIQSSEIEINKNPCIIDIKNEVLTVVTEDRYGVVTSRVLWFPYWFDKMIK